MNYSDIDKIAYQLYVDACKQNGSISNDLVGHIDRFVEWHNNKENNLKYYYDLANKILRKNKLDKLCSM